MALIVGLRITFNLYGISILVISQPEFPEES